VPKIREVDRWQAQSDWLSQRLFEMCPELSFTLMAGHPMRHPKRTREGRDERIEALRPTFGAVTPFLEPPPRGATHDDVLDALAGVWTARRYTAGSCLRLGGDLDETGLGMAVMA
jgi:predicted RNase H-like nuclease